MQQDIYGYHIVHRDSGFPVAFCAAKINDVDATTHESLVSEYGSDFEIIPVVLAESHRNIVTTSDGKYKVAAVQ